MRTAQYGQFDALLLFFNAIGHLSTQELLSVAFKNIADNLKDGGIYIFDILKSDMLALMDMADFFFIKTKHLLTGFMCIMFSVLHDITQKLPLLMIRMFCKRTGIYCEPFLIIFHFNHSMQELVSML